MGSFGSSIKNASIPQFVIDDSHRDSLFKVYIKQSVGELEQLARGRADTNRVTIPWSGDTILYYQQKEIYQGYALSDAWQVITTTAILGILEDIRTRVLEFVITIEKELDIDIMDYDNNKKPLETPAQEKVGQRFNMTINGGSNFAFGNSGTPNQQTIQVQPGDLQSLKEKLAQLGVPDVFLNDLDTALAKDADSEEQPGLYVNSWFGRLMSKVGTGAVQLAGTAATTVVMAEVRRFLGLPPFEHNPTPRHQMDPEPTAYAQ